MLRAFLAGAVLVLTTAAAAPPFTVTRGWLTMRDGVRLSATYWLPAAASHGARLPVVLEMLPYRKDDDFALRDYPQYAYLASHGIAGVRVDVRGTGSSEGALPDREYSDAELSDIQTVIAELAGKRWSNGRVGMQGISWSAFNAIMTAMRRPPHLAGLFIAHGSQDLYGNDVHYIDGALHLDVYASEMELENIVPQSPGYATGARYFADRFDRPPWTLTYLEHQRDGAFWERGRSLQTDYGSIRVPVLAIGALLDGYRDYAIALLDHLRAPLRVQIGPWDHAYPFDGEPEPQYDSLALAASWWHHVLEGAKNGACCKPGLLAFVRGSVPAGTGLERTPGEFREGDRPRNVSWQSWLPQPHGGLALQRGAASEDRLTYVPSSGAGALNWWGETTPDMRAADRNALVYDSAPLDRSAVVFGNPVVTLAVSASAPLADWVVRLEDRRPDGSVAFVTGALRNAAQRTSRTNPSAIPKDRRFTLAFPLHFSTWTFAKGDRIRLVVSNAQFPMIWATPYAMTTTLAVGDGTTRLALPLLREPWGSRPHLAPPPPLQANPNGRWLASQELTPYAITSDGDGRFAAREEESSSYAIDGRTIATAQKLAYTIDDRHPANAGFRADAFETIALPHRTIRLTSTMRVASNLHFFVVTVERALYLNGKLQRTRTFTEAIPRDFQ